MHYRKVLSALAACSAMLLAACGGDTAERLRNAAIGKGPVLDPRPSPNPPSSQPETADEPDDSSSPTSPPTDEPSSPSGGQPLSDLAIYDLASQLRQFFGGTPPAETAAQMVSRWPGIQPRLNSLVQTAVHIDWHDGPSSNDYSTDVTCSGASCTHTHPNGFTETYSIPRGTWTTGGPTPLLTRNGVTIGLHSEGGGWPAERSPSGWWILLAFLDHSAFDSQYERSSVTQDGEEYGYSQRVSRSYGALAGSRPSVSGTWRGLMTAVTGVEAYFGGDYHLLGDAELRYSASATGGSLDAEFSNIVYATFPTGSASSPTKLFASPRRYELANKRIVFEDVQVRSDGTFNLRSSDASDCPPSFFTCRIQGGFYGNAHAEAGGVFEAGSIFGAFGAKRE